MDDDVAASAASSVKLQLGDDDDEHDDQVEPPTVVVDVPLVDALKWNVFRNMYDDLGHSVAAAAASDNGGIPLPNVTPHQMRMILEYSLLENDNPRPSPTAAAAATPVRDGTDENHAAVAATVIDEAWERNFIQALSTDDLQRLTSAADYIDYTRLFDACAIDIRRRLLRAGTTEAMRKEFGLPDDLTPEEKDEIVRQNGWALDCDAVDDAILSSSSDDDDDAAVDADAI